MAPLFSTCIEWLNDWTQILEFPIVDTYDLAAWMEEEGCEALKFFVETAFRKTKTRTDALEILRALLWEWFVWMRESHVRSLTAKSAGTSPEGTSIVQRLLTMQQTAQKTAQWHAESRNLLTGHEFAHVVYGTPTAFQAAVARKCAPEAVIDPDDVIESRTVYLSPLSPFQWGWRYEPVIRDLYQTCVAGGRVDDTLGRIRHPTLPRLAASPDGLICEGPRVGRLLEIKAPVSRELNGELPRDYYCQIQLQAEVTDVEAVEYVEIRFDARQSDTLLTAEERHTFLTQVHQTTTEPFGHLCGCVLVLAPHADAQADTWTYAYSPFFPLSEEGCRSALAWLPNDISEETVVLERSVWRVRDAWTTTVPRNRRWWSEVGQPAYERFWVTVDEARTSGRYAATCLVMDDGDDLDENIEEENVEAIKEDVGEQ